MKNARPDPRDERIRELEEENARLREALERALKRIDELERRLGLSSANSSKPPSTDSERDRRRRKRRKKSGRKPGGQEGHVGQFRALWPAEKVDTLHQLYPEVCEGCGEALSADDARGRPMRRQVFDLPPVRIQCTEYQLHACRCPGCGTSTRAGLPDGVSPSGWGPALVALLAAMTVVGRMTRRQVDWFVTDVLGAPSSVGSVQTHLEEASRAIEPGYHQARRAVAAQPWCGLDETGWRLGQLPHWIWVAHSGPAAVYHVAEGRTKEAAEEVVGALGERVFITDRYPSYSFLPIERRQICHAHLLREFTAMSQRDGPIGRIGARLEALERELQREWARLKAGEVERRGFVAWVRDTVRPRWEELLVRARDTRHEEPSVVRWLLKGEHREMPWVFLDHEGVEPTNNESERAVRGPVIQRKISWGSQSEEGLRLMERLWTAAETCRRQGRRVLDYIAEAIDAARKGLPAPELVARYACVTASTR